MPNQSPTENRRWVLASRPDGAPSPDNFRLERGPAPEPAEGQMLLSTVYLSLDPYMRGRMSDAPSYAAPVQIGETMVGQTVSRVVRSKLQGFSEGDLVLANAGWQDYALSDGQGVYKIPPGVKATWSLGLLGMPGFTAWYGLTEIGQPEAGETVVVAAATGGVGSVVGQLAKIRGCRAVGIAGGQDKCRWAVEGLGFDACVDHHQSDLRGRLAAACPSGVDVYFENVGGRVLFAVTSLLNVHARIPLCGVISRYNAAALEDGPDRSGLLMTAFLTRRVSLRGYIISDHWDAFGRFLAEMTPLVQSGRLHYREDIEQDLERAPEAFIGLLEGRNFGKLIIQAASED